MSCGAWVSLGQTTRDRAGPESKASLSCGKCGGKTRDTGLARTGGYQLQSPASSATTEGVSADRPGQK